MPFGKSGGGGSGGGARDFGLLLLRVGIGLMFVVVYGWPLVYGGRAKWVDLGQAAGPVFSWLAVKPIFLGGIAAFVEFIGGMLVVLGLFFRPACAAMAIVMIVASCAHLIGGMGVKEGADVLDRLRVAGPALQMALLFVSLTFIGAGKYSLGRHVPGPTIRMEKESE